MASVRRRSELRVALLEQPVVEPEEQERDHLGVERQQDLAGETAGGDEVPAGRAKDLDVSVERKTLEADFGHLFGSQIRFHGYLSELKRRGYLTRDPRVKERKKAGLKKARKRPQFSKR